MTVWAWFVSTRVGRWLVGAVLAVGALAIGLWMMYAKGKRVQAGSDAAKDAQSLADAAQNALDTANAASEAANKVRQDAASQPPPDPMNRDDFNNTF